MKFLDHKKPISTCKEKDCENCDVKTDVTCHFTKKHLISFFAAAFPAFIIGGIGAALYSWWALLIFVTTLPLYFGLIEIRVMCSHCPHYAEPSTKVLTCWANYGSPKIWKYRPGPMSFMEKAVFILGMFAVFFIPALFMILSGRFILLAIYLVYTAFGFFMLLSFLCIKCMNFACPFNRTDKQTQQRFFTHNPSVKKAWDEKNNDS